MARTILDYVPVRKKNIVKFLENNFYDLSSIRIFDLVKNIPDENEKLNAFVKYYDQISHGSFETSYIDLFNGDNKYNLIRLLEDKIFNDRIYIRLNEILNYFKDEESKLKVIDSISQKLSSIDDIDTRLIMESNDNDNIKLKILDIVTISSNYRYLYYCNYIKNISIEDKINNINKYGEIEFKNINIENYMSKFLLDELKYVVVKKYFDINKDKTNVEITELSMNLIKHINDENIKNKVVELVKERVYEKDQ